MYSVYLYENKKTKEALYVGQTKNMKRRNGNHCPRLPDEGYDKCKSICHQPAHAEIMALSQAGHYAVGAKVYVYGITHVCRGCQEALYNAGVDSITVKRSLADRA